MSAKGGQACDGNYCIFFSGLSCTEFHLVILNDLWRVRNNLIVILEEYCGLLEAKFCFGWGKMGRSPNIRQQPVLL